MAQTIINGVAGNADITIAANSYKTFLNRFAVRVLQALLDATVFNSEPNRATTAGVLYATFQIAGFAFFGIAHSGPLVPPPQNVALVFTYTTGCTISFTGNFSSADAERVVNQNAIITGEGESIGAIVIAWAVS